LLYLIAKALISGAIIAAVSEIAMIEKGVPFWAALATGCVITTALYLAVTWFGPRFGLRL
jgi:hypothetical protein